MNLLENITTTSLSTDSPTLNEEIHVTYTPPYFQVTYQWYRSHDKNSGFTLIEHAVSSSFTPDRSTLNQYLKCVITDANGNTYSSVTNNAVRLSDKSDLFGQTEIMVTSTSDVTDLYDGKITLREAITYANELNTDIITFSSSLAESTITLTQGELVIDAPITIHGKDLDITITTTSGRLFNISGGMDSAPVSLIGLNLTGGNTTENGGAILAAGTLCIESCNIYDNHAEKNGGVIYSETVGTHINITDSVLTGNEAKFGGVCNLAASGGKLNIISSLVAGNKANYSYGVFEADWSNTIITLLNSAVIGNNAYYYGVGYNYGQILVYNSTIAGNSDYYSMGGIWFGDGSSNPHKIENSIIALNTSAYSNGSDISAAGTVEINYSLIGNAPLDNIVDGSGNHIGTASSPQDPGFVSLNPVSEPNWTKETWKNWDYSLKVSSVAVNSGSNSHAYEAFGITSDAESTLLKDVQGKSRFTDGIIDMGASEYRILTMLTPPVLYSPEVDGTTVSISWNTVPNASGYLLEYKPSTSSTWTAMSVKDTSATFTGTAEQMYHVRVKAKGTGNYSDSGWSATENVTAEKIKLLPTIFTVSTAGPYSISVSIENMENASGYTLEYAANADFINSQIQNFETAGTQTVTNLNADTTYFFRIKTNGTGNYADSAWSEVQNAITAPHPFTGYDKMECEVLMTFLEQIDGNGVKNGTKLNAAYDANNVSSWSGITWMEDENGEKSVVKIFWKDTGLVGSIYLDGFGNLTHLDASGSSELVLRDAPESLIHCKSDSLSVGIDSNKIQSAITLKAAGENDQDISENVTVLNEWSTFNVELWTEFSAEKTFDISWDANVFTLDFENSVLRNGVSLKAASNVHTDENGIATLTLTLCTEAGYIANVGNSMCAALKFYQAAENGTLKQGESLASAVTVDGKRFETVVHSVIYDINDDGNINIVDLVRFARMYGSHSKEAWLADFNSSGNVDIFDLVLMAHHYGMSSTSSHLVTYNSAYQPHNIRDVQPQPAILDEVPEETGISTAVAIPICTADLAIEEFWEEQEKEKEEKLEQILQKMR